jgi:hypothetical protein
MLRSIHNGERLFDIATSWLLAAGMPWNEALAQYELVRQVRSSETSEFRQPVSLSAAPPNARMADLL